MNWERVQIYWNEFRLSVTRQWSRLTNDDLDLVDGHRDRLVRVLQQRYGLGPARARAEVDAWLDRR
jgi:uncharacterized protein YjbJ (UPF0337 family)